MKKMICVFLISTALTACGQTNTIEQPIVNYKIPASINNNLTTKYVNIPGTRVSLVPPEGFEVSKQIVGLQKGDFGILVRELPGGDFESNTRDFSKETYEAAGLTVIELTQLEINGFKAKWAEIQTDFISYQLFLGDSTFSVMISGMAPLNDTKAQYDIKKSVLSVYYDKSKEFDPFEFARFEIDLSMTNLKFTNYALNMFIYETNEVDAHSDCPQGASLLVTQNPSDSQYLSNLDAIAAQTIEGLKNKGTIINILDKGETKVDGLNAYFVIATIEVNGNKTKFHLIVTGNQNNIFMIQAMASCDLDKNMAMLQEAIRTIKIK